MYDAVYTAAHECFDISYMKDVIQQEFCVSAYEMRRPCVMFRPKLYPDGDQWCALYGDDLQEGCAGFGDTPEKAMQQFDVEWLNAKLTSRNATATPAEGSDDAQPQS